MHWIDPDHLPETSGVVDCILLNGEGEADGLVLKDGTEVHFPPHMGRDVLAAVQPGSAIRVRGVRPRGIAMVAAISIAPEEGAPIVDAGPPDDDEGRKAARKRAHAGSTDMEAEGVVRQLLHGPKGEVRGVMLEDGRAGRFPPHAAQGLAALLVPNASVLLRGDGLVPPTAPSLRYARWARRQMIFGRSKPRSRGTSTRTISRTGPARAEATPKRLSRSEAMPNEGRVRDAATRPSA